MKKSLVVCLCMLLSGLFLQSCGPDDTAIQREVKEVLLLNYPQVTSSVRNGIATLSGNVDSEEKRVDVEKLVSEVKNVKSVVNNVEVKQLAVDVNRDLTLKATINNALFKANITTVTVNVKNMTVTLTGEAKKADEKRILDMIKQTDATNVIDSITFKK